MTAFVLGCRVKQFLKLEKDQSTLTKNAILVELTTHLRYNLKLQTYVVGNIIIFINTYLLNIRRKMSCLHATTYLVLYRDIKVCVSFM